jgi:hypothetical protein
MFQFATVLVLLVVPLYPPLQLLAQAGDSAHLLLLDHSKGQP